MVLTNQTGNLYAYTGFGRFFSRFVFFSMRPLKYVFNLLQQLFPLVQIEFYACIRRSVYRTRNHALATLVSIACSGSIRTRNQAVFLCLVFFCCVFRCHFHQRKDFHIEAADNCEIQYYGLAVSHIVLIFFRFVFSTSSSRFSIFQHYVFHFGLSSWQCVSFNSLRKVRSAFCVCVSECEFVSLVRCVCLPGGKQTQCSFCWRKDKSWK